MDELIKCKRYIKGRITRMHKAISSISEEKLVDSNELDLHLEQLTGIENETNKLFKDILTSCEDEDYATFENEYYEELDRLDSCKIKLKRLTRNISTNQGDSHRVSEIQTCHVKLPRIDLPKFSGDLKSWMTFHDLFTATVHNNEALSAAQKLQYLKLSLRGEAAVLIQGIQINDSNYEKARDILIQRYQNDVEIVFCHLDHFFTQPRLLLESATGLRKLLDTSVECVETLRLLKQPVEKWDTILVYILRNKLDASSLREWELIQLKSEMPTFKKLKSFIEDRARALEAVQMHTKSTANFKRSTESGRFKNVKRDSNVLYGTSTSELCIVCNEAHSIYKCDVFAHKPINSKRDIVKKNRLCFNCLRKGHQVNTCKSRGCSVCNAKHHSLLHDRVPTITDREREQSEIPNVVSSHCSKDKIVSRVLLPTAIVKIQDQAGNSVLCRALIDSGSESSFVREDFVQRCKILRRHANVNIAGLASKGVATATGMVALRLASFYDLDFSLNIEALILPKITCDLPQQKIELNLKSFRNLKLADPEYACPGKIDLLLGADVFAHVFLGNKYRPLENSLTAYETVFGWVLSGKLENLGSDRVVSHLVTSDLNSTLRRFWELEDIPEGQHLTQSEKMCEEWYNMTTKRQKTGRYVVNLPFKESSTQLGSSRHIAEKRLHQVERRFKHNLVLAKAYRQFMKEYETLGHMERIPIEEINVPVTRSCYLPHHAVAKQIDSHTKFRVVFDASAKTSSDVSLNDKLLVGPVLQDSIVTLLIRFRIHQIAMTADITKMYRQINVNLQDTNFQRIVWRESSDKPIQDYRLLTVTYGTASAPYLAIRSLQQLAYDEQCNFPEAAEVVKNDFYVDDLLSGTETIPEALSLQSGIIELLQKGCFEIRKWSSNVSAVVEAVPPDMRETNLPLRIDADETVKTLGLQWHPASDSFSFKVVKSTNININKRTILSEISKIFDPLGLLSPVTIKGKILMQQLWKLDLGWDDPLPAYIQEEWRVFSEELLILQNISIPRCIVIQDSNLFLIHGFCDASEKAFAANVYLCSIDNDGNEETHLVMAKTRVAPLKTISLPRLELCGAVLLARTIEAVCNSSKLSVKEIHCWTDSTIVLAWLDSEPCRWKSFVANRTSKIQNILPEAQWHHILSEANPADCASRGITPSLLKDHPLWWTGLKGIRPSQTTIATVPEEALLEEKRVQTATYAGTTLTIPDTEFLSKYSSLTKLKRIVAYCRRFIFNARKPKGSRQFVYLSAEELESAFLLIIRLVQENEFREEMTCLSKRKPLNCKSKILPLNPFLDQEGILRVGGRLRHSDLRKGQKYPILLPKNSFLTELILTDVHLSHLHAGPQLMMSTLLRQFWILSARDVVRRHVQRCVVCTRQRAQSAQHIMGDLPEARVLPGKPFLKCGVDFCGPFIMRASKGRGRSTFKGYVAVFVCFVTRALHLEVVSDLTADAFIAALKRFISRRGKCADIFSDCGTNFIGANNQLKSVFNDKTSHFLTDQAINWHFNPPSAPHMGGLWEAGVKSVKFHLRRIIGDVALTFEEFYTLLTQIEACLNSRPLGPFSSDPEDMAALTPGHFLTGDSLMAVPDRDHTDISVNRLTRWQLIQRLLQQFWARWRSEYLSRLQQRPKWLVKQKNLEVGDLVIIRDDRLPPLKWHLGRITEIFPGIDDCVRVVSVKSAEGLYKRPIQKLILLPCE